MADSRGNSITSFFRPSNKANGGEQASTIEIKFGAIPSQEASNNSILSNDSFFKSQQFDLSTGGVDINTPSAFQAWGGKILQALGVNTQTNPELVLKTGLNEGSNIYEKFKELNLKPGQELTLNQTNLLEGYFKEQEGLVSQIEGAAEKYRKTNDVNIPNYDSELAKRVVEVAKNTNSGPGRCYEGVSPAIAEIEKARNLQDGDRIPHGGRYGLHAADFDDFFTEHPGMLEKWGLQEIDLSQNKELMTSPYQIPDGSICVWERGSKGASDESGHIAVASQGIQHFGRHLAFSTMPDKIFVPIKK